LVDRAVAVIEREEFAIETGCAEFREGEVGGEEDGSESGHLPRVTEAGCRCGIRPRFGA